MSQSTTPEMDGLGQCFSIHPGTFSFTMPCIHGDDKQSLPEHFWAFQCKLELHMLKWCGLLDFCWVPALKPPVSDCTSPFLQISTASQRCEWMVASLSICLCSYRLKFQCSNTRVVVLWFNDMGQSTTLKMDGLGHCFSTHPGTFSFSMPCIHGDDKQSLPEHFWAIQCNLYVHMLKSCGLLDICWVPALKPPVSDFTSPFLQKSTASQRCECMVASLSIC